MTLRGSWYARTMRSGVVWLAVAACTPASAAPVEAWVDDVYLGWDIAP